MALKILLLTFLFLFLINCEELLCPNNCDCIMVQNLRSVSCRNKKLTSIEDDVPKQAQLLDLSNNIISFLGDYVFKEYGLHKLVVLNLSTNSISQISLHAFDFMNQLQIVDLSENVLHTIPQDVFENNLQLLKLYLGGNKFGFLEPEPILNSKSLQVIELNNCMISHLNVETFLNLPNLTTIDIRHNFILQLKSEIFRNLTKLKYLEFSDNNLKCDSTTKNFLLYLKNKRIIFEEFCDNEEKKFEKIIALPEPTEKNNLLNWNFSNCDIETIEVIQNHTCSIPKNSENNKRILIILAIITFVVGLFVGFLISCCYIYCFYIIKRKRMKKRTLLLSESSYNVGLSTPILSRHANVIV